MQEDTSVPGEKMPTITLERAPAKSTGTMRPLRSVQAPRVTGWGWSTSAGPLGELSTPSENTLRWMTDTLPAQTPPHPGLRLPGLGLLQAPIPKMSILYFPIMLLDLGDSTAGLWGQVLSPFCLQGLKYYLDKNK